MNTQQFTQKSLEAIQTSQAMAQENRNPTIMPEHSLHALIDQDGGLIPSLLGKMEADSNAMLSELDTAISQLPTLGNESEISFKTVLALYPAVMLFNSITGMTSFALYQDKYKEGGA